MIYTEVTFTIEPIEPFRDILLAELTALNFESFQETENGLQAYVAKSEFDVTYLQELSLINSDACKVEFEIKDIQQQNWNEVWESNFESIKVGNLCNIRAAFHAPDTEVPVEIVIAPKMAFGTGHHETTYQMVERIAEIDLVDKSVLDMGCGTGVLAIYAELRGAQKVHAVDIDEWSVENTNENITLNNVHKITVDKGGAEVLEGLSFNVILANINKNVLLADMATYASVLKPKGDLLLSGFYREDVNDISKAAEKVGLTFVNETSRNNWATVRMIKQD